jgi:hypothetical protein
MSNIPISENSNTQIIGVDVFWDHKLRKFRKKHLNLEQVPMNIRCPFCGEIMVKDRYQRDMSHREHGIDSKGKHVWVWVTEEKNPYRELDLLFFGGVCRKCRDEGFGKYGWLTLTHKMPKISVPDQSEKQKEGQ